MNLFILLLNFVIIFKVHECRSTVGANVHFLAPILKAVFDGLDCLNGKITEKDGGYIFALFLVKVNLQGILRDNKHAITDEDRIEILSHIGKIVDELGRFDKPNKRFTHMWSRQGILNESPWKHSVDGNGKTRNIDFKNLNLEEYLHMISDPTNLSPTPSESDNCLKELLSFNGRKQWNPLSLKFNSCPTSRECLQMLMQGSNFGYALTHRIIYLLLAKNTGDCSIFTEEEDMELVSSLCAKAFLEATFIAENGFKAKDLFMEQMAVCTVFGHKGFAKVAWINNILDWQNKDGCLTEDNSVVQRHLTEVGVVALSGAVRLIGLIHK